MENDKKRPIDLSDPESDSNEIKRPKLGSTEFNTNVKAKCEIEEESESTDLASNTIERCEPLALIKKDPVKNEKQEGNENQSLHPANSDSSKIITKDESKQKINKTILEHDDVEKSGKTDLPMHTEKNKDESKLGKEEHALKKRKEMVESKTLDKGMSEKVPVSLNMEVNGSLQGETETTKSDSEDQTDETSTVKSEGSEKENVDIKKEKAESPDVIMLSDEDDETADPSTRRSRILKKVKALQNQLRNEEATLVLLKKLRQSQVTQPQESTIATSLPKPQQPHHQQLGLQHMRQHVGPVSMNRGNQQNSKTLHNVNQTSHNNRGPQINNTQSSRSQQGPPPLVMSRTNGQNISSQHHSHSSRGNIPHNLSRNNNSIRSQSNVPQTQQQPQSVQRQAPTPQVPPPLPPPPPQDTQTPAQRQAAAKQALRKQLEKTLLQIPPPKPPPPEMNFIPSLACPDFILLLGLEEVVNHMIDYQLIARGQKNPDERFVCTPFTCVQCGSDFTPVWKREKPGSKNVICEHCVTSNQKKALKQEHTNRLKSAFVKALQQEQEIERMQASTPTPSPPVSNTTPQPQLPSAPMISAANAAAAAASAAAAAVANFRPSAEQLRQHHSFLQAQQVQLRAGGQPLGLQAFSRAPFPYNIPFAKQQDLQRQYLLDMIPRGSMPWKQQ